VYLLTQDHLRILVTAQGIQEEFTIPVTVPCCSGTLEIFLTASRTAATSRLSSERLYDAIVRPVDVLAEKRGCTAGAVARWTIALRTYRGVARRSALSSRQIHHPIYTAGPDSGGAKTSQHAARCRSAG